MQSQQNIQEIDDNDYDDKDNNLEEDVTDGWETIEYTVPEWALPYLFNGDASGLEDEGDEDLRAIADFLKSENLDETKGHWSYDSENNEAYFTRRNDITSLGDNCVDIKWVQRIE